MIEFGEGYYQTQAIIFNLLQYNLLLYRKNRHSLKYLKTPKFPYNNLLYTELFIRIIAIYSIYHYYTEFLYVISLATIPEKNPA